MLKILRKDIVLILILSLAGSILALILTRSLPQGFSKTQNFYLAFQGDQSQNQSAYYAQEKARNFTDTAVAILDSADFRGEVQTPGETLSIKKIAPQVVRITAVANSSESAQNLMTSTVASFNAKLTTLNQNQIQLKEIGKSAEPFPAVDNKKVFAAAGFVLGAAFAILAVSLKTYFKL